MIDLSYRPISSKGRLVRWGVLGFCSGPLIGAHFYNQGLHIPLLVCPFRAMTGIPCPTCGMTRSFMALVRGDLPEAVHQHLLGPALFLVFLLTIGHVLLELGRGQSLQAPYLRLLHNRTFQASTLTLLLGYYIVRISQLSSTGELMVSILQSPLGSLIHYLVA